jgi:hypothetical protein
MDDNSIWREMFCLMKKEGMSVFASEFSFPRCCYVDESLKK